MKLGIRFKLSIAFILVIIVPIVFIVAGFLFTVMIIANSDNDIKTGAICRDIKTRVEDNYSLIDDYNSLYRKLEKPIKKYGLYIKVLDYNGKILFNSEVAKEILREKEMDDKNKSFLSSLKLYEYEGLLKVQGNEVGRILIRADSSTYPFNIGLKMIIGFVIIITVAFLSLITLIITFTRNISKSILKPLKELDVATSNIANGNLDFEINYYKGDELGRFCRAFDTMRKKLKESLEKQVQDEKLKKELIASISHDLRTPISSIKGYVEGLQDGVPKDKEMFDRYLFVIKSKSDYLDHLIDDLFQFSQMELDKMNMDIKEYNSQDLIEDILENYKLEFKNSDIDFEIEYPLPSIPVKVDKYRISQVIDNLIGNATEYIKNSGKIKAGSVIMDDYLKVYIKDNGEGILEEDLPMIFERFYRGEKSRSRDYGGAGLGLSICKYIVDRHKGNIWVDSKKGKGSTFYFTIPIEQDNKTK